MRNFMARAMATFMTTGIVIIGATGIGVFVYALGWGHCLGLFIGRNLRCAGDDLMLFGILDAVAMCMVAALGFAGYVFIIAPLWRVIYPSCQAHWAERKRS